MISTFKHANWSISYRHYGLFHWRTWTWMISDEFHKVIDFSAVTIVTRECWIISKTYHQVDGSRGRDWRCGRWGRRPVPWGACCPPLERCWPSWGCWFPLSFRLFDAAAHWQDFLPASPDALALHSLLPTIKGFKNWKKRARWDSWNRALAKGNI